jgi:ElaB/YqjD/DUF883 family membrane-anchored ribosome-binding protein
MATVQDTRQTNVPNTTNAPEERTRAQGLGAQIQDKAQEVSAQMREKAQGMGTQMAEKATETGDYLSHKAQELGTQAQELGAQYYEQGRASLRDLNRTVEGQIRERPIEALLVAGGIGLILGLLWRRS